VRGIGSNSGMRITLSFAAACLSAVVVAGGQAPAVDVAALGPQLGQRVPDFSLPDQHGQTRTLASVLGPNGAMLVFFRSADW
jgi:AhpC/TSA family